MVKDYVMYEGQKIEFYMTKKKIKNINYRIKLDGTLHVSVPNRVSMRAVKGCVRQKADWILKTQETIQNLPLYKENDAYGNGEKKYFLGEKYKIKLIPDERNYVEIENNRICIHAKESVIQDDEKLKRIYEKWLRESAESVYIQLLNKYQKTMKKYDIPMPYLTVRKTKRRWGTCIPSKKMVIISLGLIKAPIDCIEYVILHELIHFKYIYHNQNFYHFFDTLMPDNESKRKILNEQYLLLLK